MPDENLEGEFVIGENEAKKSTQIAEEKLEKNNAHFYSSLSLNPVNITFENQEEDEDIALLVRRDLITNVPWITAAIFLILIPLLVSVFSSFFTPFFNFSERTIIIFLVLYYLVVFGFLLVQFALWYFNVGIVTTRRIVDFNVAGILEKQLAETKLNLVEDVNYSQIGSIRSVFDYGDVFIQTAAKNDDFIFDRAPQPARIVKIIANMIGGPR